MSNFLPAINFIICQASMLAFRVFLPPMASGLAPIHRRFLILAIVLQLPAILHASNDVITVGSALFAMDDNSTWTSPSGDFAFGFRRLPIAGDDVFLLAIWYAKLPEQTIVWSANRQYLTKRQSKVELTTLGRLVLSAPSGLEVWRSNNNDSAEMSHGALLDTGNFVITTGDSSIIWNSFNEPTDTILPTQVLGVGSNLLSSMSETNYKGGKFNLRFTPRGDFYNLILNQIDIYSGNSYGAYFTREDVCELILNQFGVLQTRNFRSQQVSNLTTKGLKIGADYYYRATLDFDGIFRLYAHRKNFNGSDSWSVIWYIPDNICMEIYTKYGGGPCGYNSICEIGSYGKPNCTCAPGFSFLDINNRYGGCKQNDIKYKQECNENGSVIAEDRFEFFRMKFADWPYADYELLQPITEFECEKSCLRDCFCVVATFQDPKYNGGKGRCWKKKLPLSNGRLNRSSIDRVALFKKLKVQSNTSSQNPRNPNPIRISAVLIGTSITFFFFVASLSLVVFCLWQGKLPNSYRKLNARDPDMNLRSFTYKDLEEATSGFAVELGRGSFGTVYKGVLVSDYSENVAVKKLDKLVQEGEKEFKTEMTVIGQTRHKNLVRLLGYCNEGDHRLLVYEFMGRGSLSSLIFGVMRPSWQLRIEIATGIARGLTYLHEECGRPIIHCDIKPQNILLDDYFIAKISDFGLAKLLMSNQTRTMTGIRGTMGYVAPEWFRNTSITVKVDVYSFGVVLLEIISCKKSVEFEMERAKGLTEWAYDCYVRGEVENLLEGDEEALSDVRKVENLVMVALWCVQELPTSRPSMREVTNMIEGILEVTAPERPFHNI